MKSQILQLAAHVLVFSAMSTSAAIRYVNVNSAGPASPYTNWTTAATTIQDAVDEAVAGDQILVTNGVYQTGGRVVFGAMTNRVAVDKPVTVQSVNGAALTVIRGFQMPGTTNGDSAIRCVYLGDGAALVDFTLTNGATRDSGDDLREQRGGGVWCESASALVSNCVLTGNSASIEGGGASGGMLNNCLLTGNSASIGGGAFEGTLNSCILTWNSAIIGGGACEGTLNNCALTGNSARDGGGAYYGTLNNCTLSGNSASGEGGGASGGMLNNCIVYYNRARSGDNYFESSLNYSCTMPLPSDGVGNISAEPQLASASHVSAGSPCRGSGSPACASGLDLDGETWAKPPSIGCDEYHPGLVIGPLSVSIQAAYRNVAAGFVVNVTAAIDGRATANRWDFGDGTVVSNQPYASHGWAAAGDYSVVLQAYNDTYPGGISATVMVHVVPQPIHYVSLDSANPVAPYTNWATAANTIQEAVDAASVAGALVLVTNGVYQTGERVVSKADGIPSRVAVTNPLVLRSVNGAAVTVIQGGGHCVYLANRAALVGFTLTNGAAGWQGRGGGVLCESASAVVSNCVLTGNSVGLDGHGGGSYGGTLNNCTLTANTTIWFGGGAYGCTLNNCTVTGNSATTGGGAFNCTLNNCTLTGNSGGGAYGGMLNNCIVYYNSAPNGDNYSDSFLSYSCTTPLPSEGIGNFTNAPLFVDDAGGDLRLQSNSPCINGGSNASSPAGPDLDGSLRITGGTVDVGAYEFQSPQSLISYAWLRQYSLPTDGWADFTDCDGDGLNNWQEWRAGTDPTNVQSVLRLLTPTRLPPDLVVTWESVPGRSYFLEWSTNLGEPPGFERLATHLPASERTTTFTHANAVRPGPLFYRVGVE